MQHPFINRYCKPALVVAVCLISWGCQSGPIGPDGKFAWNQNQQQATDNANESDQNRQVNQLNNDNESLHAQLAQARQQYRVTSQELELIKSELKQATDKLANQLNPAQPANLAPPQQLKMRYQYHPPRMHNHCLSSIFKELPRVEMATPFASKLLRQPSFHQTELQSVQPVKHCSIKSPVLSLPITANK